MTVTWLTAVLVTPRTARGEASVAFWQQVTGWRLSPRRGAARELATLVTDEADAVLRVQDVTGEAAGVHLDVHVDDLGSTTDAAVALGGRIVEALSALTVVHSPGGMPFCLTPGGSEGARPAPVRGASGRLSLVDQVCLDVPAERIDDELTFWSGVTGWPRRAGRLPAFAYLERPQALPLRLLFQQLQSGPAGVRTRAHLDLACEDRDGEEHVHRRLGARVVRRTELWTTMEDPAGRPYCLTRRDPLTGLLPEHI